MSLVDVALPVPLLRTFSYRLPEGAEARPGVRVRVPFGRRQLVGVVLGPGEPVRGLRAVGEVLDPEPILTEQELTFARWVADYYLAPPGECVSLFLPPRMADGEAAPPDKTTIIVRATDAIAGQPDPRLGPKMAAALQSRETRLGWRDSSTRRQQLNRAQ